MIFIRDFLLWGLVTIHVVGGAFLFRRLFPRESRWLAFIVPELVVVLFCCFLEHHIPLTSLRFLLPFTTAVSLAAMAAPRSPWRSMRLPSLLFASLFAFAVVLRMAVPNIADCRDGISDLGVVDDFLFGQTLPPDSTWLPPVKLVYYYYLEHYAASLLIRLLGVDPGTGFNLSCALLSTYIWFLMGAGGWILGRGRLWIALLMPVLAVCTANGSGGYIWLMSGDLDTEHYIRLQAAVGLHADQVWLLRQLKVVYGANEPELMPPGYGAWMGALHSVQAGQFVTCFTLLSLLEMLRRRRANWPWICLILSPFLILTTCTWVAPVVGVVAVAGGAIALWKKRAPIGWGFVLITAGLLVACFEPMLVDILEWEPPLAEVDFLDPALRTQWIEFLVQWWILLLPALALLFAWKWISPITRVYLIVLPPALAAMEIWTFGWRGDMTEKIWSCLFAGGWMLFLPEIARMRAWPFRGILVLVGAACAVSLCFWFRHEWDMLNRDEVGRIDGRGEFRSDPRKARLVESLSQLDGQTIIPGITDGGDEGTPLLMTYSHTRGYATWIVVSDLDFYSNGLGESHRRSIGVSQLYAGKLADPLAYLRQNNIAGVVIYPDDNIAPAVVQQLEQQLAPFYTYEDAWDRTDDQAAKDDIASGRPCAGVFVYHPEVAKLFGTPKPAPPSNPQ